MGLKTGPGGWEGDEGSQGQPRQKDLFLGFGPGLAHVPESGLRKNLPTSGIHVTSFGREFQNLTIALNKVNNLTAI